MAIERIREITGTALPLRGDSTDTDRIIPARYLRSVSFEGLEQHLFADDRVQADARAPGSHPLSNPAYDGASLMLVNANFGCGSSREHAPQAIRRRGFRAVIGESFSEIFFGNSVALGMPCVSATPEAMALLMDLVERTPTTPLTLDLAALTVSAAGQQWPVTIPTAAREAFLEGSWDATGLLLERFDEVEAVAARLPYVAGWSA
jgi:3-isopropylmalate/(R)-2-methylmalate dehydratase small subunit